MPTFIGVYFLFSVMGEIKTKSWPVVEGKIVSSKLEGDKYFIPRILYEFTVNDADYKSNRIDYTNSLGEGNKIACESLVATYSKGKLVKVHYNPKNPRLSVLEPGFKGFKTYSGVIGGVALYTVTFGSYAIIFLIEKLSNMPVIGWIAIVAAFALGIASGHAMVEQEHKDNSETNKM